jgi:tRNA1(Val) A37 N6-methylase TrmN6
VLEGVDELTDDAVAGGYRVLQRRRGHRFSVDDVLTAWEAARVRPEARAYLDLGAGIGSVLLMVIHKVRPPAAWAIEAQQQSFDILTRNVHRNGLDSCVRARHGDLRDAATVEGLPPMDLVTGTPPYFPVSEGTPSTDPQRAHARMEMRGGVEDYVRAGARLLGRDGRLVLCADARRPERVLGAAREVGLRVAARRDVVPRAGRKGALFSIWTLGWATGDPSPLLQERDFVVRDEAGRRTAEILQIRRFFDLPASAEDPRGP